MTNPITARIGVANDTQYTFTPVDSSTAFYNDLGTVLQAPGDLQPKTDYCVGGTIKSGGENNTVSVVIAYQCPEIAPNHNLVFGLSAAVDDDCSAARGLLFAGFVSNVDFRLDSDFVESFYKESDTKGYSDLVAFSYIRGGEPYKLLISCTIPDLGEPLNVPGCVFLAEQRGDGTPEDENSLVLRRHVLKLWARYAGLNTRSEHRRRSKRYALEGPWNLNEPVHENMVLCALISAGILDSTTRYSSSSSADATIWEFLRGVIWNDDPNCSLFDDKSSNNHNFSSGISWAARFYSKVLTSEITYKSHHGNMQFLHAMAGDAGESKTRTAELVLKWAKLMYELAITATPDPTPAPRITKDTLISDIDFLKQCLEDNSDYYDKTLGQLLLGSTTSYESPDIPRRALGSLFHTIQDSYAPGHCERVVDNVEDLESLEIEILDRVPGPADWLRPKASPPLFKMIPRLKFANGTCGKFFGIVNFHCYSGQDKDFHEYYDLNDSELDPSRIESFDSYVGGRDAINQCRKIADLWSTRTTLASGAQEALELIFQTSEGPAVDMSRYRGTPRKG